MTDRQILEAINRKLEAIDGRIEAMNSRVEAIDGRIETMDGRIETMDGRIEAMDGRIETMDGRIETMDGRMNSMSNQIGQLIHHVAEVRQTNIRLEAGMQGMRGDIRALDEKIETKTDFVASKIDHFVEHFSIGQTRERTRFEEERHLRSYTQTKTDQRLDAIEQRLEHLEASSS